MDEPASENAGSAERSALASAESLTADLRQLGICSGDLIMLHVSLRALGPMEGGPAALLQALETAIGPDGTLLMVLGAYDEWAWVNDRPPDMREALLRDALPFDPELTSAEPEVGYFAEFFRQAAGTIVNDNPEGRFAARGAMAVELLRDLPWHDYYGLGSPLDRLCRFGGHVLRLGADPDTTTLLHLAEYLADIPDKRRVRRHRLIREGSQNAVRHIDSLDDSDGIVLWDGEDYFALILQQYIAAERARHGLVGMARSDLIPARDLVDFAVPWMEKILVSTH